MGTQDEKKNTSKAAGQKVSPSGSRGRRRLDYKRFQGKTMFLDLPGYRHMTRLEQELTSRGATLETQFHAGVKYLITTTRRNGGDGQSLYSPSTPSPLTPGKSSLSQVLSPATDHSLSEVTPVRGRILTRSQQMLQLSRRRGNRKADLQALAQQWGSKVVTLEELLKELKRLKPLTTSSAVDTTAAAASGNDGKTPSRVRSLRGAYLKVEDLSRAYRPLVMEMKRWPRPLRHVHPKASPFDPPHLTRSPLTQQQKRQKETRGGGGGGGEKKAEAREKRPGHCECCGVKFEDLKMHLQSTKHQEYAENEDNFKSLDLLMSQGKSFDQFIADMRSGQNDPSRGLPTPPSTSPTIPSQTDSILFMSLPTSKATPSRRLSPRKRPPTRTTPSKKRRGGKTPPPQKISSKTQSVSRKRKAVSLEATPTTSETTPTKRLRFTPEISVPVTRIRGHTHSTTPPSGVRSPARKRARPAVTPSPSPEGVRRSPRLLMKQLAMTDDQKS